MSLIDECCSCLLCGWSYDENDEEKNEMALEQIIRQHEISASDSENDSDNEDDGRIHHLGIYSLAKKHSRCSEAFLLPTNFDPEVEYYRMYTKLGDINYNPATESNASLSTVSISEEPELRKVTSVTSLNGSESMIDESERVFASSSGHLTPREVVTNLNRYLTVIKHEHDLKRKRELIRRYEIHKFDFDADNRFDAETAQFALDDARNLHHPEKVRLYYYQVAIKYTNDMPTKKRCWDEYLQFCKSLAREPA